MCRILDVKRANSVSYTHLTPLVASLVSKDKYDIAQSLHTSLSKGAEIIGMGLAGFLLSTSGIVFTFIVDVSAFIISGLLVSWLHLSLIHI